MIRTLFAFVTLAFVVTLVGCGQPRDTPRKPGQDMPLKASQGKGIMEVSIEEAPPKEDPPK
jgi:hypothetical protein